MKKYKLLVTGCGRSGTSYICSVLGNLNPVVDIGHESWLGRDGIASFLLAFDIPAPRGPEITYKSFNAVLHQVRHPLGTISSYHTAGQESWEFVKKCLPQVAKHSWTYQRKKKVPEAQQKEILLASVKNWYFWNLQAEKISSWTYKVEDLPEVFEEFCSRASIKCDMDVFSKNLKKDSRKTRQDYVKISWEEIKRADVKLYDDVRHLAEKYGY